MPWKKCFWAGGVLAVFLLTAAKIWPNFFIREVGVWFLSLHAFLEFFGALIVITLSLYIFLNSRLIGTNRNLLMAAVLFSVGILDILHALSFAGMPQTVIFPSVSTSYYFWLMARFTIAVGLIIFAKWHSSAKTKYALLISAISSLIFTSAFYSVIHALGPGIPPLVNIMGSEMMKVYFEYSIIGLLILGGIFNMNNLRNSGGWPFYCFLTFLMFAILSEFYNIFSRNIFDLYSVFSHILKDLAYIFLFISFYRGFKNEIKEKV